MTRTGRAGRRARSWNLVGGVLVVVIAVAASCGEALPTSTSTGPGNPRHGATLVQERGCGSCHRVPGVDGADGRVAAPLDDFHERRYIAGVLLNDHENLTRFIDDPQSVDPRTGMPDPAVTREEAADIAAFLLHRR